jgi:hypothetical protein
VLRAAAVCRFAGRPAAYERPGGLAEPSLRMAAARSSMAPP